MASNQPAYVLGFHGCERALAESVVGGGHDLAWSENPYDWLGHGIYFWENDPYRAFEWATRQRRIPVPWVLGAFVDLGNCLNLLESKRAPWIWS